MQVLFLKNVEHWKPMPRRNDSIIALEVNWHYLKGEKWPHQYFRVVAAIVKLAQNPNCTRRGVDMRDGPQVGTIVQSRSPRR